MENDTTVPKEGLLEPVLSGSVTFENSILDPLRNNYLYEESKESFTYNSGLIVINPVLQKRYSAFRAEKQKNGYSEEELEETFGFLLLDDKSRAKRLAETGLIVGHGTCTTLGDCSKGVYISRYSDCLDLKRWYDGKTGFIILLKLTKGRVKEVTENYTQNFTPPTTGFDCHVSEQLRAVCATTSSFLAFERTQYYMYELLDGGKKFERCPRHVRPFAVVAFSYGKTSITLELKEKSQEKSSFHYQPWSGQLKVESVLYNIGLKSTHGAMFPANLPKTVKVDRAIGVSELRKTLPQAVFETSPLGEVSLDGKWFSMYDVISIEAKNDLASLTQELKEKDMALVVYLEDGGFLLLLHSSNFLSYEGVSTDKAFGLQGMFVYPESRTVPRETKSGYRRTTVSSEVLQILPALNYAELEMEKCPPKQHEEPLGIMEKHLQNFAALILPGLTSSPTREASMFPDQYDVPDGFPLFAPKWTEETGDRLKTYLESPHGFQMPVSRASEVLAAGKQQRSDDHDDDVYYYLSSPEAPQTPAGMVLERDLNNETEQLACRNVTGDPKKAAEQQAEPRKTEAAELPHCATIEEVTPGAAAVAAPDDKPAESTDPSPTSGDLPTEHYAQHIDAVNSAQDGKETSERVSGGHERSGEASNAEMEVDRSEKVDCLSDVLPKVGGPIPVADKQEADLPTSISTPTMSVNRTEAFIEGCNEVQPEVIAEKKPAPNRRGKRRKRKALKRNTNTVGQMTSPLQNTTLSLSSSEEAAPEQSSNSDAIHSSPSTLRKDWRSLPRQKKHWNADASVKRTLRSDYKSAELPSDETTETENNTPVIEITVNVMPSAPKRKMEGINMRERYGLKNIVTDCGFVFVPHGSEVAPGEIKSNENAHAEESPADLTNSPSAEKPTTPSTLDKPQVVETEIIGHQTAATHVQNISPAEALTSEDVTAKDPASSQKSKHLSVPESTEKNKSTKKGHVYRAISISKLKTVLKRAKRTKSHASRDHKSVSDNPEPSPKRGKPNNGVELSDNGKLTPRAESAASRESMENARSKPSLRTTSSQEKRISKIPKENGCSNFDNFSPNAIVKQAGQQLASKPIENRVKGKRVSSDGQCKKQEVAVGAPAPSDALNLLADLALSVNSDEILPSLGEKHPGAKTGSSPQSVIHLLQDLRPRLKSPPKSPFPEGLVVTGDLILEISKEHSYSQPTSLPSGLRGMCPQVQPPVGSVESCLSLKSDIVLKLPDLTNCPGHTNKGGKNGWRLLTSVSPPTPAAVKSKVWSSLFLRCRSITEKENSIQVTRQWKENYDFKYDSKFTNDRLDKCVTRALHGKWDFSSEDTYEQVHLIFHMWIGLFYSKPTSRFFHFDQTCPPHLSKDPAKALQCAVQTPEPLPDVDLALKDVKPTLLDPVSDALDLSVKTPDTEDHRTDEEHPQPSSGIQSRPEDLKENKLPPIRPIVDYSSIVFAEGSLMNYRSNMETSEEKSTPGSKNCSDQDEDTTDATESPYTKLLESNSAYGQLCDHAASMRIEEQKSPSVQKSAAASSEPPTSKPVSVISSRMPSSGKTNMGIFHQIIGHVRPVIISKVHDSLAGRKIILKSLSFKDKYKDGALVSVHSERFKDELFDAANKERERKRALARADSGNKNACELKTETGIRPAVAVRDGNESRTDVKSLLLSRDETPKVNRDENRNTTEKPVSGDRNNKVVCNDGGKTPRDGLDARNECAIDDTQRGIQNDTVHVETPINDEPTINVGSVPDVRDEIRVETPDGNHNTKEAIKPLTEPQEVLHDDETQAKVAPEPDGGDADLNVPDPIKSGETVEPVRDNSAGSHDVRSDTCVREQVNEETSKVPAESNTSVNDGEITRDECEDSVLRIREDSVDVLEEPSDKLCIPDDIVDVRDVIDTTKEAESELDVRADVSADVQDVSSTNKPGLDVKTETPASTLQDVNDETKCQLDVGDCSSVHRQHDRDTTGDTATPHEEMHATEQCVPENDESNGGESTAELDRDADVKSDSEEQNAIDESQDWTDCIDMDISDYDNDSEHESQEKVHETNASSGEIFPKALEEDTRIETEAHVASYKEPHIPDDSFVSSTSDQLIMSKEGSSDVCIPKQNEGERAILHDAIVVSQSDVLPVTEVAEPCEITHCSVQGTAEEAEDLAIINANVGSREELEKGTDRKPLVPTICEKPAAKKLEIYDASPPALQIDTELNSRCCTPTLDEPSCSYGTDEGSGDQELSVEDVSEREDYCVKKNPRSSWLALDSSDNSQSGVEKSPPHRDQIFTEEPCWPDNQFDAKVKENSESKPFTHYDLAAEEDSVYYGYDAVPASRNFEEIEIQDEFECFSAEYADEAYEELPSQWTRSSSLKTDLTEWYAPDVDRYYANSISVREVAYRPRENTESDSNLPGWVQRMRYSQSSPNVEEPEERRHPFKRRAGLSDSSDGSEGHGSEPKRYGKKKRKRKFCRNERDEDDLNAKVDYSIQKTFSCSSEQSSMSRTQASSPYQHKEQSKQPFDWRRYFRREGIFDSDGENDGPFHEPPSSIVTMFDKKGNRVIFESPSTRKRLSGAHDTNRSSEEQQSNSNTESLMEHEFLVFSEKMTHLLKNCKSTCRANRERHRANIGPAENPMTIQFSRLDEQNSFSSLDHPWPTISKFKINVDMSDRKAAKKPENHSKPLHLQSLFCERGPEATWSKLSDISKDCSKSYHTMMNDLCIGKPVSQQSEELKRKWDAERAASSKQSGFCGRIKKDMFNHLHDNLNTLVRQACKTKYKFYILVTSMDPFFEETKDLLEAEGHTMVEPYQFDFNSNGQTPLLIILRNEDIAEHIFKVPHLLELKKSSRVLFAGIDQPDDVVNLTHQELFAKGGFVVFDETALDTLNLENMKKVVSIMEELDKKGKWKWFLHYRDSRKLRENARSSPEAQRRKQFVDCCQEAGIVEVLPYHECDVISRDRPDYLRCLVRLQIQNVSARFPVFITDTPDDSFEKTGILTMNIYTFSRIISNDTCCVS